MADETYQALLADIQAHGLKEPIWTYQGTIIDGRHRYLACQQLGIEPTFREWQGSGSLIAFAVSLNLQRRHLTSSQKAIVALEIEKHLAGEARRNMSAGGGDKKSGFQRLGNPIEVPVHAAKQAASLAGTNHQYIVDAKTIVRQAPELKERILNGALTIPEAKTLAKLPDTQRAEAVRMMTAGEVKTAKAAVLEIKKATVEAQAHTAPSKPRIALASWETWLAEQAPCDLLLTDPPYSTDVTNIASFAQAWLPLALSKVKSTGRAYVCIGAYPQELEAYLAVRTCMAVRQILVWSYRNTLGPAPAYDYKQNWQVILYFRGPEAPQLDCPLLNEQFAVQEINAPDGRLGDRYHAWQKPDELAERLIRHSTRPGERVLDCFAGTGTFLLAAHRLGRVALGCDRSPEMLALAERRGCEIGNTGEVSNE